MPRDVPPAQARAAHRLHQNRPGKARLHHKPQEVMLGAADLRGRSRPLRHARACAGDRNGRRAGNPTPSTYPAKRDLPEQRADQRPVLRKLYRTCQEARRSLGRFPVS
jgi:hypothetical protein